MHEIHRKRQRWLALGSRLAVRIQSLRTHSRQPQSLCDRRRSSRAPKRARSGAHFSTRASARPVGGSERNGTHGCRSEETCSRIERNVRLLVKSLEFRWKQAMARRSRSRSSCRRRNPDSVSRWQRLSDSSMGVMPQPKPLRMPGRTGSGSAEWRTRSVTCIAWVVHGDVLPGKGERFFRRRSRSFRTLNPSCRRQWIACQNGNGSRWCSCMALE